MFEYVILWDWLGFAVRWLHVVTAIAWIGSIPFRASSPTLAFKSGLC